MSLFFCNGSPPNSVVKCGRQTNGSQDCKFGGSHVGGLLNSDQAKQTPPPQQTPAEIGVHPIVIKIAVGAAVWFVAISWLAFAWGPEIDYLLVIVTLFFAIFLTLFLLTASFSLHDSRWPVRRTSFREFLKSNVRIGRGTMSGREVLIEIALIPVVLAFGATLIGLAWVIFG